MDKQAAAIADWAEQQTKPAHTPKYSRLTDDQRIAILRLAKLNTPQTEIAQVVGCDQGTVSRWLAQCQDTTEHASTYLRGQALRMSRNIVQRGQARDHIQALKGIGVLADDSAGQGVVIQIGIKDSEVTFASQVSTVSTDLHKLNDETGSDN